LTQHNRDVVVEILRQGGAQAISLFLQVGLELRRSGGTSEVNDWIQHGLSALPETEHCALVGMLIEVLDENYDVEFQGERDLLH
jgi:hypothetical protein